METATTATTAAPQAPAPQPAPTQPPPLPPTPQGKWSDAFSPEIKGLVETKGWNTAEDMGLSYINLEKLRGVPEERLLKLPEKLEGPEMDKIYAKLGKPEKPEDYKIPIPQGQSDVFAKAAAQKLHELNITGPQAEKLAAWWNEQSAFNQTQAATASTEKNKAEDQALQQKQGAAYPEFLKQADAGAKTLGLSDQDIKALGQSLGYTKAMTMLQTIGSKISEASFEIGQPGGSATHLSPEAAQYQIRALSSDPTFTSKLFANDVEAKTKWSALHADAYPGEVNLSGI